MVFTANPALWKLRAVTDPDHDDGDGRSPVGQRITEVIEGYGPTDAVLRRRP